MISIIAIVWFFINFGLGIYFAIEVMRGFAIDNEYSKQLKKEGKVKGYFDHIHYVKERNPKGGFAPLNKMRQNLLKDSEDSEILIEIVDRIILSQKEIRRRGVIVLISFICCAIYFIFLFLPQN